MLLKGCKDIHCEGASPTLPQSSDLKLLSKTVRGFRAVMAFGQLRCYELHIAAKGEGVLMQH
jgi:hypothetical protein